MEQKVFLEENRSKFSNNMESTLDVGLSNKVRLLPNESLTDTFSLYSQYNKERDECTKFRLILGINPVCSNVLFNMKTEVVLNEGSSATTRIYDDGKSSLSKSEYAKNAINNTEAITYNQAMADTEYSHSENGNFVYHCGYNIFNNHMLRNDGFVHVNKISDDYPSIYLDKYNTLADYLRDGRGDVVEEQISARYIDTDKTKMHLYRYDSIISMKEAFSQKCKEKDGWFGFTNPGNIEIQTNSGKTIMVNRMLASNNACEFIDLYPGRDLYSFVPKYNPYRKRIEKNWDYCITYPYKADKELINTVCGGQNQAIRAEVKVRKNTASISILECSSYFKHNLKVGDYINVYYYRSFSSNGVIYNEFQKMSSKVKVISIGDANGDHTDRIFNIKLSDVQGIYGSIIKTEDEKSSGMADGLFYKKVNGSSECSYYFRKFKKIKNIDGDDLRSDINKIAFGKNIYGDETAQIVFTDDINIDGLVDNNGRPVSEVFLTVVKNNKGHEIWYDKDSSWQTIDDENIEYSHCFGKLTSGIDFSGIEIEPFDYNVHYLHNLDSNPSGIISYDNKFESVTNTYSAWGETILAGMPQTIEDDITIDNDEFYGDIVEFDNTTYTETQIGYVFHRFNTAQREVFNDGYRDIFEDKIDSDDYDVANGSETAKEFTINQYYINDTKTVKRVKDDPRRSVVYANIMPEGYYYNPHIKIRVREESNNYTESSAKYVNYTNPIIGYLRNSNNKIVATTLDIDFPTDYGFLKGDYIAFFNNSTQEISWGEISSVSGMHMTLQFDTDLFTNNIKELSPGYTDRKYYAFWSPNSVPLYAKFSMTRQKFVWRNLVAPSEMIKDNELYDTPFSNGRFYIEKNINFFLRRQDPYGVYGLSRSLFRTIQQNINNPMQKYVIQGYDPIDLSETLITLDNQLNTCF